MRVKEQDIDWFRFIGMLGVPVNRAVSNGRFAVFFVDVADRFYLRVVGQTCIGQRVNVGTAQSPSEGEIALLVELLIFDNQDAVLMERIYELRDSVGGEGCCDIEVVDFDAKGRIFDRP